MRRGTPHRIGRGTPHRMLPGIVPGSDGVNVTRIVPLPPRWVRVSLLGRIVVACPGQCGAGRRIASGEDAQPTAPRHRAGERWRQRHADRSSRAAVGSCLPSREDRRSLPRAMRRGTPHRIGRGRPTHMLPGIVPGSDGVNVTRVVPLAPRWVRVSLLGRIVVACPRQCGAGRRIASGEDAQPTCSPASCRGAMASTSRGSFLSRRGGFVSPFSGGSS